MPVIGISVAGDADKRSGSRATAALEPVPKP